MRYYLIKESSEIPLKSWRTRPKFERALSRAVEHVLRKSGMEFRLSYSQGVFYLESEGEVSELLTKVFGIHSICEVTPKGFGSLDDIVAKAEEIFKEVVLGKKFAVRVKRYGSHSFTSLDVARSVGSRLLKYSAGVDLESPEVEIKIEIRGDIAYYVHKCWKGIGGLPVGVEGRALAMFSGGFDSTLAAFLTAKRGIEVDFLHFYMGSAEATRAAISVMKRLAEFMSPYEPRAIVVNFVPALSEIRQKVESRLRQVVLRVLMHDVAQRLAEQYNYDAVATGESVGQASSQTLRNLKVVDSIVRPRVALLRPLSGADKEEIVSKIRELDLYDHIIKVEEVCRLAEGPVETRARVEDVKEAVIVVSKDVIDGIISGALLCEVSEIDPELLLKSIGAYLEVDDIPEDWLVVDIREREKYLSEHIPGAIHVAELKWDTEKPVVLYCDYGSASLLAAMELRKSGIKAYSLRGGYVGYKRRTGEVGCAKASPQP